MFHKNNKFFFVLSFLSMSILWAGTKSELDEAEKAFRRKEYFKARRITERVLKNEPANDRALRLNKEVNTAEQELRDRILGTPRVSEEMSDKDQKELAKIWLDKARLFADVKQYDKAVESAEQVFLHDPNNKEASRFIDQIKKAAYQQGQGEVQIVKSMMHDEITERVKNYKDEAVEFLNRDQLGPAYMAVQKILLLDSEDKEAQHLAQIIEDKRLKKQAA